MRVVYMGKDKESAVAGLRWLVEAGAEVVCVVAPGAGAEAKPGGAPKAGGADLAEAARSMDLAVATDRALYDRLAGDPSAAPGVGALKDVDLVLSFLFWRRIRTPLIALPRIGCLNFHPAPLPDYRGLGGYNAAILDQAEEYGVSAHFVDEAFDTGDLIRVDRFPIDPERETAHSLEAKSQDRLLSLFRDVVGLALAGKPLPRAPQGSGRYIDRSEFEAMKRVHPDDPPGLVDRKIRAFWYPPYPGAKIEVGGRDYTLVSDALLADIGARYGRS